jgi:hypothetical protein
MLPMRKEILSNTITHRVSTLAGSLMVMTFAVVSGWGIPMLQAADGKAPSFLDAKAAGPDFAIQGEYVGTIADDKFGAQVIARGRGQFEMVLLPGGLPGAGWTGKDRQSVMGETANGLTQFAAEGIEAAIAEGHLAVNVNSSSGNLKKVQRQSPTLGQQPPEVATVLLGGTDLSAWNPARPEDGELMGVGTRTKAVFADFTLHLEFRTPFMPESTGQGRGNSGMYLQDQYECQILDSFGLEGLDNECGGIYKNARPLVNMCLPPLSWQTYDVEFTSAKFSADGKQLSPAKCTIHHNGVLIHDQLELQVTPGGGRNDARPGALYLQDHGDAVRFRNIWIVERKS